MEQLAKLGIDPWGVVLYFAVIGVLLLILAKFLYKPLLKYLDERQALIKNSVEEAENLRQRFEEETTKQKTEQNEYIADAKSKIAEAQRFAKESAKELIADANMRREKMLAEATKQAEAVKDGVIEGAQDEIKARIQAVVLNVLQKSVPQDVVRKSVDESLSAYKKAV